MFARRKENQTVSGMCLQGGRWVSLSIVCVSKMEVGLACQYYELARWKVGQPVSRMCLQRWVILSVVSARWWVD